MDVLIIPRAMTLLAFVVTVAVRQSTCNEPVPIKSKGPVRVVQDTLAYHLHGPDVIQASTADFSSITYLNDAGERHGIVLIENEWYYGGMELVDSNAMKAYLNQLSSLRWGKIYDEPRGGWQERLIIEGKGLMTPIIIDVKGPDGNRYLIHTSEQPDLMFETDSCGLYKYLIRDFKSLWPR